MMERTGYTVGWIAPLPLELTAARSALEHEYGAVQAGGYTYFGGRIGAHAVVLGVQSRIGTDAASDLAARMRAAFPNIEFFLVVGIGGGVPRYGPAGAASEIVLGDVVVSYPRGNFGGVIRYDAGAWEGEAEGRLNTVGHTNSPPDVLLGAVNQLQMSHATGSGTIIPTILPKMRLKISEERHKYEDPGPDRDRLYQDNFSHPSNSQGTDCQQCCDHAFSQQRLRRGHSAARQTDTPKIHYGNIASSNQLQLSPADRNRLQEMYQAIGFEMEGAGVIQRHPCLIVRGICDYSDSHKNKIWQPYAAVTAAAYARELLESMPVTSSAGDPSAPEREKEVRELLKDLYITDPCDDKRRIEDTKGGLLKDSYRWILENSDFRRWRDDEQSRLLWIKGGPGKGKTMLLCGIINELNKSMTKTDQLSYFFCQATDLRINNATAVLRGLLYLLVNQQPSLVSHIRKKHDHAGKALFEDANAWVALSEIFTDVLQDLSLNSTSLVIDALDECVADLPKLLDFIVQKSCLSSRVKWIVSSRSWPDIEERLERAGHKVKLCLELNAESVSTAVSIFIQHKVLRLADKKKYDEETRNAVLDHLSLHANDTFLWVALVCQNLEKIPRWNTLAKLNAFPPGLDALYERMMEQICKSDNADLCKRILASVAIVYRPITLQELTSFIEMLEGMADDLESLREIIGLCGSFLTIRGDTIYFVHQSAKDFLFTKTFYEIFPSGTEEAHHRIFSRSLQVMSRTLRKDMYSLRQLGYPAEQVEQPNPDPLAASRYSCIYWVDHLCDWNPSSSTKDEVDLQGGGAVDSFLRQKYLYWLEALSLYKSMSKGVVSMASLEVFMKGRTDASALNELVRDARRFIMSHKWVIENSPLQAYISALLFSPTRSLIRGLFKREEPNWITIKPAMEEKWSPCLQTLYGHSGSVLSVAFSHDSARVASASADKTVKIWDARSGECLQTLNGHSGSVLSVAFSHDSARVASASDDKTVKIWDARSGECLQTLTIGKKLDRISFDISDSYLHTEIGVIDLSALLGLPSPLTISKPCSPRYQGLALSADGVWITHNSENLVWLPSEYRPSCSAVSRNTISIGVGTGRVWICKIGPDISGGLGTLILT